MEAKPPRMGLDPLHEQAGAVERYQALGKAL